MANKNILAFRQLAPFIYELKATAFGLDPKVPSGLENVDTPEKATEWLKTSGQPTKRQFPQKVFPLKSIFPDINLGEKKKEPKTYYYSICSLRPKTLIPTQNPPGNFKESLKRLWADFVVELDKVLTLAEGDFSIWFESLLGAWQSVSWCLTDSRAYLENMIPLYEKSRVMTVLNGIKTDKVLLIQGDFQGIQNFIFTSGSRVNKRSAKLLRGRSFYVSLLTELAALRVLEQLDLPGINLVNQAAGKFLILAEKTEKNDEALRQLEREFGQWFVKNTLATSNLVLARDATDRKALLENSTQFRKVMDELFKKNELAKLQRPLIAERDSPVLSVDYSKGINDYDDRLPHDSALINDELMIGDKLVKTNLLCITWNPIAHMQSSQLKVFGYYFTFLDRSDLDKVPADAVRLWDFSLPDDFDKPLFTGIARRDFNGYVSRFTFKNESKADKYLNKCEAVDLDDNGKKIHNYNEEGDIKPFEYLACDDRIEEDTGTGIGKRLAGVVSLGVLKGDVDNLGKIFREGLGKNHPSTLCRMLTVSRMLQSFFTVYLPVLCSKKYPNTYTVFAGGDDFFLIGPWHSIQDLAADFHTKFGDFVANDDIHFSTGIILVKPDVPPRTLAALSEDALSEAKKLPTKNAVSIYGVVAKWSELDELRLVEKQLKEKKAKFDISNAYLYSLYTIIKMSEEENEHPKFAIWRSLLSYNTARLAQRKKQDPVELVQFVVANIKKWEKKFSIPLTNIFYRMRIS